MPDFALAPYILAMTGASILIALVAWLPLALKRCPCPADYLRRPRDGELSLPQIALRPLPMGSPEITERFTDSRSGMG